MQIIPMYQTAKDRELEAQAGDPFPRGWTADVLMSTDFPPLRWAVPGLIAEGLTLLVGAPKLGKSWLALNIAASVAMGGRALGKVPVEQGRALVLALEDPGRRLQDRLRIVLEGDPPPPMLHLHPEWPLLHNGGLDLLDKWLALHPDCRLVVIDVLAKIRGRTSDRESSYSADYGQLTGVKDVADRNGIAVVVVHHTRKQASDDFLDDVSGTQGLAGAADATLVLKRTRAAADAVLKVASRDVEDVEYALKLTGGRWTMLDGPATDYELGDTRFQILRVIRASGAMTPKQASDTTGIDRELVRKTIQRMASDGQLNTHGGGTYFATDTSPHLSQVSQIPPAWDTWDTWDTPSDPYTDVPWPDREPA